MILVLRIRSFSISFPTFNIGQYIAHDSPVYSTASDYRYLWILPTLYSTDAFELRSGSIDFREDYKGVTLRLYAINTT